eukprot:1806368-Amphidinium_carterae.1
MCHPMTGGLALEVQTVLTAGLGTALQEWKRVQGARLLFVTMRDVLVMICPSKLCMTSSLARVCIVTGFHGPSWAP